MPELMERPKIDRLENKHRNMLQFEVMKAMLGEKPSPEDELEWVSKYGEKVSDLIDYHEHDEIRNLAKEERYDEAADLLIGLLE